MQIPFLSNISTTLKSYFLGGNNQSFYSWAYGGEDNKSQRELLNEYRNLVYTCVSAIAEEVAKYQPVISLKALNAKPIENHPFLTLLERPNPYMTQYEFFEAISSYMDLSGEVFLYFPYGEQSKKPKEIHIMRPDRVKVVTDDETGDVIGYRFVKTDGNEIPFDTYEIWHHKNFNPTNPYRGLGTVQAGLLYIDTENSTARFQRNFMRNQATPSGVVSIKNKMTREGFTKLKKQWKESQSGLENVGKTLFTNGGDIEFTKIGLSLADLDSGGIKDMSKQDVLNIFRVPRAILGETDSSGLGRANIDSVEYIFGKWTIEPRLTRLDDMIRLLVKRFYGQEMKVEHVSQVPEDRQAILDETTAGVDKWLTRNEVRVKSGLPPVDGGDVLYMPFSQVPIDEPQPQEEAKILKIVTKDVRDESTPDRRYFNQLLKIEEKASSDYEKGLKKLLVIQQKKVIDATDLASNKQIVETMSGINFSLTFTEEEITAALLLPLIRALRQAGELSLEHLGEPDEEFLLEQAIRDSIFDSTDRLMKSFNEETALKIQKQLVAGLAENETPKQLAKRIESIYSEAKGFRAERIAVTEAHDATNEGAKETFKQLGYKQMKWVANPGACEFCRAMDGTTINIGATFVPKGATVTGSDGGEYIADYKDVENAHLHPHCTCYLLPVKP